MEVSLGALGDSFYEYMLKLWLLTNKQFNGYSRMYKESSVGIKDVLIQTTPSGYKYLAQIGRSGALEQKMEHLVCFVLDKIDHHLTWSSRRVLQEECLHWGRHIISTNQRKVKTSSLLRTSQSLVMNHTRALKLKLGPSTLNSEALSLLCLIMADITYFALV